MTHDRLPKLIPRTLKLLHTTNDRPLDHVVRDCERLGGEDHWKITATC